jgi:CheY-like chemotaxis protein
MFRLELPIGDAATVGSAASAAPESIDVLKGKRIVVVDDEQSIRDGMQQLLARWGCLPVIAATAAEALQLLRASGAPDLIICDQRLAGDETGTHAIDAIRARYGAPIPAILLTGEIAADRLHERLAGGHLLQRKPLRPAQLRATCNHLLTSERA